MISAPNVTIYRPTLVIKYKKYYFYFSNRFLHILLPKGNCLVGFIQEKCRLNTKLTIFWQFWPQNVTFYKPTLVMNCKNPLFFYFYNSFLHILLPKGDFFGGLGGFIKEKCRLDTKIPIFWWFWPQNVTF